MKHPEYQLVIYDKDWIRDSHDYEEYELEKMIEEIKTILKNYTPDKIEIKVRIEG